MMVSNIVISTLYVISSQKMAVNNRVLFLTVIAISIVVSDAVFFSSAFLLS